VGDQPIRKLQRDWEDLGSIDPLWAILSDDSRRAAGWDLFEFLATGEREIEELLRRAGSFGLPLRRDRALDFGCGVGRLTRALSPAFGEVVGVDISGSMIGHARRINADLENCRFVHNVRPDLATLDDATFDLVYANLVLQHMPGRDAAERYVRELVRVVRPGALLVFQVPGRIPLRHRLQPRRRLYEALRALGLPALALYGRGGLHPVRMIDLPEERTVRAVKAAGGEVLAIDRLTIADSIEDRTYYVRRAP
jgi:SAM-dependent methyltransferase